MRRALALAAAAPLACAPSLAGPSFEPLDPAALREAFASPSAIVDEASSLEVADQVVASARAYELLAAYLGEVFAEDPSAHVGWPVLAQTAGEGTTVVYLLFACPGPALDNHDVDFAFGTMRLDAELIAADLPGASAVSGHALLSFDRCQLGEHLFDGDAPIYIDAQTRELLLEPELELGWVDGDAGGEGRSLDEPIDVLPGQLSAVLYTVSTGTLVLEQGAQLRLRGANGALVCALEPEGLSCAPP